MTTAQKPLMKEKLFYQEKNVIDLGIPVDGDDTLMAISANLISKSLRKHVISWKTRNSKRYGIVKGNDYLTKSVTIDYDFPSTTPHFEAKLHQKITTEFIVENPRCIVLNGTGSGKTLASLWGVDYLMKKGEIKRTLIIGPLTGIMDAWQRELNNHFITYNFGLLAGSATTNKKKKLLANGFPFYLINHDGITALIRSSLIHAKDFDMVIYDESTAIKTVDSERFKYFHDWFMQNPKARLVLMTGTPIAQSQLDAYSPAKMVDSRALKELNILTYNTWKNVIACRVTRFKSVETKDTIPLCFKIMQPSICFSKKDCIDLPDFTFIDVNIEETAQQKKMIKDLQSDRVAYTEKDGSISVANSAVLKSKLLQCWSGVVKDDDGAYVFVDNKPRLIALEEILIASDSPVVVFTAFKGSQQLLVDTFSKKGFRCGVINGDVVGEDRKTIIDKFQAYEIDVLFAHPKTTAHSIDLTRGCTIVFFTPIYSNELYLQGLDRIQRLSSAKWGHEKFTIYHFTASLIETEIFRNLKEKTLTQEVLLHLIRDTLNT